MKSRPTSAPRSTNSSAVSALTEVSVGAIALHNQGQARQAVDAWEKSVSFEARNYDAMFNMAVVAKEIGDRARATLARKGHILC